MGSERGLLPPVALYLLGVTIPPSGLGTDILVVERDWWWPRASPSHTVGSEHRGARRRTCHPDSHHPTQWARNPRPLKAYKSVEIVTIPHGGLGTGMMFIVLIVYNSSPSHTVGSELCKSFPDIKPVFGHHPTRWARNMELGFTLET